MIIQDTSGEVLGKVRLLLGWVRLSDRQSSVGLVRVTSNDGTGLLLGGPLAIGMEDMMQLVLNLAQQSVVVIVWVMGNGEVEQGAWRVSWLLCRWWY